MLNMHATKEHADPRQKGQRTQVSAAERTAETTGAATDQAS